jgi:NADH dehydrogenase FAD-containing subunit
MTRHPLVLVGGGHAHVRVIRALAERPRPACMSRWSRTGC